MLDGMPDQGTPLPVRFADRLAMLFPTVMQQAVGGTVSGHCLLQRGLRDAQVSVVDGAEPASADGSVPVRVDGLGPCLGFQLPGELAGVAGLLSATWEEWVFTPTNPADRVVSGTFSSRLREQVTGMRHVVWTGKNNILQRETVLADVHEIFDDAPEDTLVLGHWCTPNDPAGSDTGEAVAAVNDAQREAYGDRFVDMGAALRDPDALQRPVLRPLRLMEQQATHEALERGVVPPALIADDDVHLNGWGNLLVLDVLVGRLRELGWTA